MKIVGKALGDVAPTFGWDLVVLEPKTEQIMSEGGSFKSSSEGMDEPFLNLDPVVEDCEDSDGDRSDSVVEVLQSQTIQKQNQTNRALSVVSKPQFQDLFLRLFVDFEPSIQKPPQDLP